METQQVEPPQFFVDDLLAFTKGMRLTKNGIHADMSTTDAKLLLTDIYRRTSEFDIITLLVELEMDGVFVLVEKTTYHLIDLKRKSDDRIDKNDKAKRSRSTLPF